jgi:hypothetical protein
VTVSAGGGLTASCATGVEENRWGGVVARERQLRSKEKQEYLGGLAGLA